MDRIYLRGGASRVVHILDPWADGNLSRRAACGILPIADQWSVISDDELADAGPTCKKCAKLAPLHQFEVEALCPTP